MPLPSPVRQPRPNIRRIWRPWGSKRKILNDSGFDAFVKKLDPNIVLFDRFFTEEQFGWRVTEFAPNALRILDTEDLHSLRQVREQLFKNNIPFTVEKWLQSDVTKREIAAIYRSDLWNGVVVEWG